MDKEYIDREAALAEMEELFHETEPNGEEQVGFLKCHRIVRTMPAADVAPVVHGEWVVKFNGRYGQRRTYCSVCGKHSGIGGNKQEPLFCPNCGAKMDRVEHGN